MTNDEILKQEFLDQLTTVEKKHYEVTNHATWGKKHDEVVVSPRTPKEHFDLRNYLFKDIYSIVEKNGFLSEDKELWIVNKNSSSSEWQKFWKFSKATSKMIEGRERRWNFIDVVKLGDIEFMLIDYTIKQYRLDYEDEKFLLDEISIGPYMSEIENLNPQITQNNEEQKTPKITLNATQMVERAKEIVEQAKTKTLQQIQPNSTEENTIKKGRGR